MQVLHLSLHLCPSLDKFIMLKSNTVAIACVPSMVMVLPFISLLLLPIMQVILMLGPDFVMFIMFKMIIVVGVCIHWIGPNHRIGQDRTRNWLFSSFLKHFFYYDYVCKVCICS